MGSTLAPTIGAAQTYTAVVKQNVSLRPTPSSSQPAIRLLLPPEELRVLSLTKQNSYYNVSTDAGEEGWVYAPRIEIDESRPGAIVVSNVNLRPNPSSANPAIRLLTPPEELELLQPNPTNRYYNVRTSANETGWVWGPNIELAAIAPQPGSPATPVFPDAHDPPPSGWTGPVFKLSQNYPTTQPAAGSQPWKAFDFRTQGTQYLRAVLNYALDGNQAVEFDGNRNAVRKWYHTPWLHATNLGREFIHGLTRERSSRPRELHPNQASTFANYAVGFYNPAGGYVIGQVWKDPDNPDPAAARFPDGTVGFKLLFTTATVSEVPYLTNAFEWDAHISATGSSSTRTVQKVRLLQIDIAVRDSRANSTTGWVFGTFAYDGTAPGATPWDRMAPIGLTWGNDPSLTPTAFSGGARPAESVILNRVVGHTQHLGWLERLNGPVDNPRSSCLSCHSTAQDEPVSGALPGASLSNAQKMRWFRNIQAGSPFDAGQVSLDYSLQLSVGIERFRESNPATVR
jgi:hypothetical protein